MRYSEHQAVLAAMRAKADELAARAQAANSAAVQEHLFSMAQGVRVAICAFHDALPTIQADEAA